MAWAAAPAETDLWNSIHEKNVVGHVISGVLRILPVPVSGQSIPSDLALQVRIAPRHPLAFREVADPGGIVRAVPSIVKEVDGLFRIQGQAEQQAWQQYTVEGFFAMDHRASNAVPAYRLFPWYIWCLTPVWYHAARHSYGDCIPAIPVSSSAVAEQPVGRHGIIR
jgi:hypothetical protein